MRIFVSKKTVAFIVAFVVLPWLFICIVTLAEPNLSIITLNDMEIKGNLRQNRILSTEEIRNYCKSVLGVPYNYSRDSNLDEVGDHYYANLNYLAAHLYINDDYKFMYLSVPKVACSNWKRLLLKLQNVDNPKKLEWPHNFHDFKRLSNLPRSSWKSVLQDYSYFKFLFVRDPWIRLVSAYVDRFTRHDKWWYSAIQRLEGSRMIRHFRKNATEEEISIGADVRFEEFIRDILDRQQSSPNKKVTKALNEHWNTQFYLSGICHPWMKYDLIAKYEDLDVMSDFIFKRLNISDKFDSFPAPKRNSSTVQRAIVEYALLNSTLITNLSSQLRPDMDIFGYDIVPQLSPIIDNPSPNTLLL